MPAPLQYASQGLQARAKWPGCTASFATAQCAGARGQPVRTPNPLSSGRVHFASSHVQHASMAGGGLPSCRRPKFLSVDVGALARLAALRADLSACTVISLCPLMMCREQGCLALLSAPGGCLAPPAASLAAQRPSGVQHGEGGLAWCCTWFHRLSGWSHYGRPGWS